MFGVDYSFAPHPSPAALAAAGVRFACRYISADAGNDGNGKNLLPAEARALLGAGLAVVMVAESYAARMKEGHPAGVADAQHADTVVRSLGMPGVPVYFAADWDAAPSDQAAINAYLDGAASVIGHQRTGIYGGYRPVKRSLDAGKAAYAWQTVAWSAGVWDPRAHFHLGLGVTFGGVLCDRDESRRPDFGQWPRPGVTVPRPAPAPTPAPSPPRRLTADGGTSLRALTAAWSTPVDRALWLMARDQAKTAGYGNLQSAYIRAGDWDAPMPRGMLIWVG